MFYATMPQLHYFLIEYEIDDHRPYILLYNDGD